MADTLEELTQQYNLTPSQIEAAQKWIIALATRGISPVDQPRVVILGGQPGAGKTGIQNLAMEELSYNAVVCNSDNFREFHPKAREIKVRHEEAYPAITGPFSQIWALGLQKHCREKKISYLLETTMRQGKAINQTINAIKEHGYRVDIKILAVNRLLSLLGTYERLEDMRRKEGVGRIVSVSEHDVRYSALPEALREIHQAKLYDNLTVYGRTIGAPGQESNEVRLIASNPANLVREYLRERDHLWTAMEKQMFRERVRGVENMMRERKAPASEIEEFRKNIVLPERKVKQNLKGRRM